MCQPTDDIWRERPVATKRQQVQVRECAKDTLRDKEAVRRVSFGQVFVREHERMVLEDAFLAMSWVHLPCQVFASIDEFRDETTENSHIIVPRLCSVEERTKLLCDYGYTMPEIEEANRQERARRLRMEYMKYQKRGERSALRDLVESIKTLGAPWGSKSKKTRRRQKKSRCSPITPKS